MNSGLTLATVVQWQETISPGDTCQGGGGDRRTALPLGILRVQRRSNKLSTDAALQELAVLGWQFLAGSS